MFRSLQTISRYKHRVQFKKVVLQVVQIELNFVLFCQFHFLQLQNKKYQFTSWNLQRGLMLMNRLTSRWAKSISFANDFFISILFVYLYSSFKRFPSLLNCNFKTELWIKVVHKWRIQFLTLSPIVIHFITNVLVLSP